MSHTHRYATDLSWTGSTGIGYESYGRTHRVTATPAATALELSSDTAFCGDPDLLNPEQLVLAAASSCQMLSFLAAAARARVDVVAYADTAEAVMPEDTKPMQLTDIVLRPVITIGAASSGVTDDRLNHLVEVAHRGCFIANSLRSRITIEATFRRS